MSTQTPPSDYQEAMAHDLADALRRGDYLAAVRNLAMVNNQGYAEFAAEMLRAVIEAAAQGRPQVSVQQTIGTVPRGATVVGYRADRI